MTCVWILVKHKASEANKKWLSYLHKNIKRIKKTHSIKVVIVYPELVKKLNDEVDRLPSMIMDGSVIFSFDKMRKMLNKKKVRFESDESDMDKHWVSVLGEPDEEQRDFMDDAIQEALKISNDRKNKNTDKNTNKNTNTQNTQPHLPIPKPAEEIEDNTDILQFAQTDMEKAFWKNNG